MNTLFNQMLKDYPSETTEDKKKALREAIQQLILLGLSKGGFFNKGTLFGGTALRLFYGLDRYSEDLDFSLLEKDSRFFFFDYYDVLKEQFKTYGLSLEIESKMPEGDHHVRSALVKGNLKELINQAYGQDVNINKNEVIRIKLDVDINPQKNANVVTKMGLYPTPYTMKVYDLASLFACKINAILSRSYIVNVKGRDLYDYLFLLKEKTPINLPLLKDLLVEEKKISEEDELTLDLVKELLTTRFNEIDYQVAKNDAIGFVFDSDSLSSWNASFFISSLDYLKEE